jgi:NitT/TauT family transport system permease protein
MQAPTASRTAGAATETHAEPAAAQQSEPAVRALRDAQVRRRAVWGTRLLALAAFIGAWEALSGAVLPEFFIGDPVATATVLWDWTSSGFVFVHIGYTLLTAITGFLMGSVVAIALGLLFGLNPRLYRVVDPFMNAFYSIPKIAFAPLLVTWLGLGLAPKVLLAAIVVFFLMFNATLAGIRLVDRDLLDQIYLMGGSRGDAVTRVVLPTVAIHVLHGLRMSFPYALHGAILGELIAANTGLGYLLQFARGSYNTSAMIASLLVVMIIAVIVVRLLDRLQTRLPKT